MTAKLRCERSPNPSLHPSDPLASFRERYTSARAAHAGELSYVGRLDIALGAPVTMSHEQPDARRALVRGSLRYALCRYGLCLP